MHPEAQMNIWLMIAMPVILIAPLYIVFKWKTRKGMPDE